jgi:hypothetical protein
MDLGLISQTGSKIGIRFLVPFMSGLEPESRFLKIIK